MENITQEEADELFDIDINRAAAGADELIMKNIGDHDDLPKIIQEVLVEMVFQLGKTGVSKFRNMWAALKEKTPPDYKTAAAEMLDSRWAKQTPNRAKRMSDIMASLS